MGGGQERERPWAVWGGVRSVWWSHICSRRGRRLHALPHGSLAGTLLNGSLRPCCQLAYMGVTSPLRAATCARALLRLGDHRVGRAWLSPLETIPSATLGRTTMCYTEPGHGACGGMQRHERCMHVTALPPSRRVERRRRGTGTTQQVLRLFARMPCAVGQHHAYRRVFTPCRPLLGSAGPLPLGSCR